MNTSVTIIDPSSKWAGREVRINYGPFSLQEFGLALGMKSPVPVIILATGQPGELETVVEAEHLLITDGPAIHCSSCGEPNPRMALPTQIFCDEAALTACCAAFQCLRTGQVSEWPVGGPETAKLDDAAILALPRVVACCEAHADRAAIDLNPNWRAISQEVFGADCCDPRDDEFDPYFGE